MKIPVCVYKIIYSPGINVILRNLNKALRRLVPSLRLPPSGVIRIRLHNRKKLKFHTNQSDFVGFCLFWNGVYRYEYLPLFEKVITRCRSFIDIGANGGLYSLVAASISENISVLAFDPTRAASHYLNKNINTNRLSDSITAYPYALSDQTGETGFYEVKNPKYPYLKYNLGGSSSMVNYPPDYSRITVRSYSFDDFLKSHSQEELPIDFIKIDAEGAEPMIIKGMTETIGKHHPVIVCEILPDESGQSLEELFKQHGYHFYMPENDRLVPVETVTDPGNRQVRNCFFVHPEKFRLVEEFVPLQPRMKASSGG